MLYQSHHFGLHFDDDTVRIAVGLRFTIPICTPHTCRVCGAQTVQQPMGVAINMVQVGLHHCHAAINGSIHMQGS